LGFFYFPSKALPFDFGIMNAKFSLTGSSKQSVKAIALINKPACRMFTPGDN
jgi:hypothetical protein